MLNIKSKYKKAYSSLKYDLRKVLVPLHFWLALLDKRIEEVELIMGKDVVLWYLNDKIEMPILNRI